MGVGTTGGSVVTGSELSCGNKYNKRGISNSNRSKGMMHTQIFDLKFVGTATISKSPAP